MGGTVFPRIVVALALAGAGVPGRGAAAFPPGAVVGGQEAALEGVDGGEVLLGELNCVACHAADRRTAARLASKTAPLLGKVARRANLAHLRQFILNPAVEKPGATMPALLHGLTPDERNEAADSLLAFLASLAPPRPAEEMVASPLLVQQGRALYHQIGCVACHAPQESASAVFPALETGGITDPDALQFVLRRLEATSVPLGPVERKYSLGSLAEFLVDPVQVRPAGRMPGMNLGRDEALALAAYLLRAQAAPHGPGDRRAQPGLAGGDRETGGETAVSSTRAARGRKLFARLGCAACHGLGPSFPTVRSASRGPPLARLNPVAPQGCLDAQPRAGLPRFHLTLDQRQAMRNSLMGGRLFSPLPPPLAARRTLAALNCLACHARDGMGGPPPSRGDYFTTAGGLDLGDEGRLPPHLNGTGRKLRPEWLEEVLLKGSAVRPYVATRMPQYGPAASRPLLGTLLQADASPLPPEPVPPNEDPEAGRQLVGSSGYGCIACHRFGRFGSLGPGFLDLTVMTRRLRWGWFRQYLDDPISLRPGTRMPSFWPDGQSADPKVLAGDVKRQKAAVWHFLSQGARALPPPGLAP